MERTMTLEEIGDRTASDLLHEVARGNEPLIVILEEGQAVTLEQTLSAEQPKSKSSLILKPLITLPGFIPDGWQDAIYENS